MLLTYKDLIGHEYDLHAIFYFKRDDLVDICYMIVGADNSIFSAYGSDPLDSSGDSYNECLAASIEEFKEELKGYAL